MVLFVFLSCGGCFCFFVCLFVSGVFLMFVVVSGSFVNGGCVSFYGVEFVSFGVCFRVDVWVEVW